jgi:CYTH domain-containing protein
MGIEIERKFLVSQLPFSLGTKRGAKIRQGYIIATDDGLELRVRQKDERFFQTVKFGEGLARTEIEIELSEKQFMQLWPNTQGRRVSKVRYPVPVTQGTAELDIFDGELDGLLLVEVEFDTVDESRQFEPPDWFGTEVTEDKRYKNKHLSVHGIPK